MWIQCTKCKKIHPLWKHNKGRNNYNFSCTPSCADCNRKHNQKRRDKKKKELKMWTDSQIKEFMRSNLYKEIDWDVNSEKKDYSIQFYVDKEDIHKLDKIRKKYNITLVRIALRYMFWKLGY